MNAGSLIGLEAKIIGASFIMEFTCENIFCEQFDVYN